MNRKLFLAISVLIAALAAYILFFSGIMPKKTRIVLVTEKEDRTLTELFEDFGRKNPDIILDIVVRRKYDAEEYVVSGKADMWLPLESNELSYAEGSYRYKSEGKLYGRFAKIAFTPMILVSARERYSYTSTMTLQEIYGYITGRAVWQDINGETEWGRFRFDCPRPDFYEDGADCILLFIHHYFTANNDPREKIGLKELDDENVKEYIRSFLRNVSMESSPGNYFLFGFFGNADTPEVDICVSYEQVFLSTAECDYKYWPRVRIHYPDRLTVSKPRYLVSMAKSLDDPKKAEAISRFEEYMLSDDVQLALIGLGYRPVKATEATEAALAELEEKYGAYGFRAELPELRDSMDYTFLRQFQDLIWEYLQH